MLFLFPAALCSNSDVICLVLGILGRRRGEGGMVCRACLFFGGCFCLDWLGLDWIGFDGGFGLGLGLMRGLRIQERKGVLCG